MNLEIRTRNMEEAYESLEMEVGIIAVGDENCIYKLPDYDVIRDFAAKAADKGKRARVVFPKIPQNHFGDACDLLAKISALDIYLTLNDFGLIYEAKCINLKNGFAVGRNVAYSLFSSPWYGLLVKDESPQMRMAMATNNMESKLKLDFIKNLGGNEIEIEYMEEICKTTDIIRESGFKVSAHYDACLVAYGRCCPVMKFNKEKTLNCAKNQSCHNPYHINLYEKFVSIPVQDKDKEYSASTHYVKDDEIAELFPTLFIHGNGLYRKNNENRFVTSIVTTYIINSFLYRNTKEQAKAISAILHIN